MFLRQGRVFHWLSECDADLGMLTGLPLTTVCGCCELRERVCGEGLWREEKSRGKEGKGSSLGEPITDDHFSFSPLICSTLFLRPHLSLPSFPFSYLFPFFLLNLALSLSSPSSS